MVGYLESHGKTENLPQCTSSSLSLVCDRLCDRRIYYPRRTHAPDGVKAKSFDDRMEKTKKELAIKKLQAELKEEKQAELTRYNVSHNHTCHVYI